MPHIMKTVRFYFPASAELVVIGKFLLSCATSSFFLLQASAEF
jgi:hypothetical protein